MKKGFTLIELLAVIVILAIIALIATPIILGIINDARKESQERSIELYASAAKNAVAKYQLNNTSAPTSFEQLDIEYDGDVVCTTKELYADGSIYLADCTVNGDAVDYTYGEPKGSSVSKACTIERQDASKYSVGDVVTCTLSESTDKFYIIEEQSLTATTVQMLTEKSIHTTEYRQSDSAGTVAFATEVYWAEIPNVETSPIYSVDANYAAEGRSYPYVYGNYSQNLVYPIVAGYINYLNGSLTNTTGKLLSYDEANTIEKYENSNWLFVSEDKNPYWLGSEEQIMPISDYVEDSFMFTVYSFIMGHVPYSEGSEVRPVITVSTNNIQ